MVKILGSSKIDSSGKMTLGDGVVKALGVKSGDSLLFSKELNETDVNMVRAEGAHMSHDRNYSARVDFQSMFSQLKVMLMWGIVASAAMLVALVAGFGDMGTAAFAAAAAMAVLAVLLLLASYRSSVVMSNVRETNCPVRVTYGTDSVLPSALISRGGSNDGKLYVDDMFGTAPSSVSASLKVSDGVSEIRCTRTRTADGYTVYSAKTPREAMIPGTDSVLTVMAAYSYGGKTLDVMATFGLHANYDSSVTVSETGYGAEMSFDDNLNKSEFDDTLFDPTFGGSSL